MSVLGEDNRIIVDVTDPLRGREELGDLGQSEDLWLVKSSEPEMHA